MASPWPLFRMATLFNEKRISIGMNSKVAALLMTALLVVPAAAISPIDLVLHPSYLIKMFMQAVGLEKSTEGKLTESSPAEPPAEYTAVVAKVKSIMQ